MAVLSHPSTGRNPIRDLVARHPLAAFVVLALTFSAAWLLSYRIDLGAVNGFGILGSLSPALAAMIVSALLRPGPSGIPARKRWVLFGISGILALAVMAGLRLWTAAGLVSLEGRGAAAPAYSSLAAALADVLAAGVVAFVVSAVHSPRAGVRDLLSSLNPIRWPVRWGWWIAAVAFYPVVLVLGNALAAAIGLSQPAAKAVGPWPWLAVDVLLMFLYCLFGGGGLEEPGWRGFALPRLQQRFSPLRASLILAVIWTLWHWPMLWPVVPDGGPLVVLLYLLQATAPLAILFTAAYNRTKSSLPIVILLHASINVTDMYLPASTLAMGVWLLLMVGLGVWMWRAPRTFAGGEGEGVL